MENSSSVDSLIVDKEVYTDEEPPSLSNRVKNTRRRLISEILTNEQPTEPDPQQIFQKKYFPGSSQLEWNDWRWQLRNSFRNFSQLRKVFGESCQIAGSTRNERNHDLLPLRITPYYASLIQFDNPEDPIYRSVVPSPMEFNVGKGEASDPLHENHTSPCPNLVHRYPDRVLFLITGYCSTYCRYCTRSHMVAKEHKNHYALHSFEPAFRYISENKQIRDVLLSGGDPLTLPDARLEYILKRLKQIPHIQMIRIGTKVPAVLPQRITPELVAMLKKYHPVYLSLHFTHPSEITPATRKACEMLADAGIPLGSQTVLLKGINDNVDTMKELMHQLLTIRVRPYYLYQCDPILGSSHFRTSIEKGLEIIQGLRGFTTGYAVPTYVVDAPGGGGKIPLFPGTIVGSGDEGISLVNFEKKTFLYPDYETSF